MAAVYFFENPAELKDKRRELYTCLKKFSDMIEADWWAPAAGKLRLEKFGTIIEKHVIIIEF